MKFLKKISKKRLVVKSFIFSTIFSSFLLGVCAEEGTGVDFNLDFAEMFKWTNMVLHMLMPVVYITLGVSLAFIIIGALKGAFR